MKGGREGRDIDAITLAQGVEALGAGEIMLNSIDRDGTNSVRPAFTTSLLFTSGTPELLLSPHHCDDRLADVSSV